MPLFVGGNLALEVEASRATGLIRKSELHSMACRSLRDKIFANSGSTWPTASNGFMVTLSRLSLKKTRRGKREHHDGKQCADANLTVLPMPVGYVAREAHSCTRLAINSLGSL